MNPNDQVYPTSCNDLIEMMNSGNFEPDSFKSRSKRSNRNKNKNKQNTGKEEETVGAVIKPTPTTSAEDPDPKEDGPDSDIAESIEENSEVSSQENDSSGDNDIDTDMERVIAMIHSWFNEDTDMFDPKAQQKKYYANCNAVLNDNKIVRCLTAEPIYEDDDYVCVDFNDPMIDDIWAG